MSISDDIKDKADYTDQLFNAFEHIGIVKHMWLEQFGAKSEKEIDAIIEEASVKADEIVKMNKDEYKSFIKEQTIKMMKQVVQRADEIGLVDEEEEFENERRENGNLKGRIS